MPFRLALVAFTALTLGACFGKSDGDEDDDDWGDEDSGDSSSNGSGSGGQGGSGSGSGGGEGSGDEGGDPGGDEGGSSGGDDGDSDTGPPVGTGITGLLYSDAGGWGTEMVGEVVSCTDCTWGFQVDLVDIGLESILFTVQSGGGVDVSISFSVYYGYSPLMYGVIVDPGYIRIDGGVPYAYYGYIRY